MGETDLFYAVKNINLPLVELLLAHGANPNIQPKTRILLLDDAYHLRTKEISRGRDIHNIDKIIQILKQHGAVTKEKERSIMSFAIR